jgi:hypothetical protein
VTDRKVDIDSFLWPLIQDLERLATVGVIARRWINGRLADYQMRAHLIVISGDMPAISKVRVARTLIWHLAYAIRGTGLLQLMSFKGIGARFPCRWCTTPAIRAGEPGPEYGKYYLATKTADHPDDVNYEALPVRTHSQIVQDVQDIRQCRTKGQMDKMQKAKGINN